MDTFATSSPKFFFFPDENVKAKNILAEITGLHNWLAIADNLCWFLNFKYILIPVNGSSSPVTGTRDSAGWETLP
jgi:hypothetical protein